MTKKFPITDLVTLENGVQVIVDRRRLAKHGEYSITATKKLRQYDHDKIVLWMEGCPKVLFSLNTKIEGIPVVMVKERSVEDACKEIIGWYDKNDDYDLRAGIKCYQAAQQGRFTEAIELLKQCSHEINLMNGDMLLNKNIYKYLQSLITPQPTGILRWVKASERLPKYKKFYHCIFSGQPTALYIDGEVVVSNGGQIIPNDKVEWLEEIEAPQPTGIEVEMDENGKLTLDSEGNGIGYYF